MNRLDWNALDSLGQRAALARPAQSRAESLRAGVEQIVARVRADGDVALRELTTKFDRCALHAIEVSEKEWREAEARLAPELKAAIDEAATRIDAFHRAAAPQPVALETAGGVR